VVYAVAFIWTVILAAWLVRRIYRIAVWRTHEGSVVRTCLIAIALLLPAQLAVVPGGAKQIVAVYAAATFYGLIGCYGVPWVKKRLRARRD
jgi:hypothetical protein